MKSTPKAHGWYHEHAKLIMRGSALQHCSVTGLCYRDYPLNALPDRAVMNGLA